MKNFNLKQLRVFISVAETGSFTASAGQLFLSQSTVSSHIMALEEELGSQLFQREAKKKIQITPAGRRLLPYARDIIQRCQAIEDNISGYSREELVLGASTVPAQHLVPGYVATFLKASPGSSCYIQSGDSEEIIQKLLDNEIQIGFVGTHSNRQALNWELIREDHLVVITANDPSHQKQAEKIQGKDLLTEPLILREQGSGTQAVVDFYLDQTLGSAKMASPLVRTSDPILIKELVARGVGISIMSALSVAAEVESGRLLQFELEDEPVIRKFYMVYRKKAQLSEGAKQFLEIVRGTVSN